MKQKKKMSIGRYLSHFGNHDAELAFMEIRHSYSTFPLKTAVPYPTYPTNGSVLDLVIDEKWSIIDH